MNLPPRPEARGRSPSHPGPHRHWIAPAAGKANPQTRTRQHIAPERRLGAILPYRQIHSTIRIVIANRSAPTIPLNADARVFFRDKSTPTIAPQPQPPPCVVALGKGMGRGQILRKEQVIVPIPVEVRHAKGIHRSTLGGRRQRLHHKALSPVKQ